MQRTCQLSPGGMLPSLLGWEMGKAKGLVLSSCSGWKELLLPIAQSRGRLLITEMVLHLWFGLL